MNFDEIQFELGVGTQCGNCECAAREVVQQCCATQPVAALHNEASCPSQPAIYSEGVNSWSSSCHSQPA
ncbi:bacterioferritin-associated ferredoxin [Corticibacter populi]|nr:bacterioferritin-associated ferredoxin [Corticibacter populi]